MIKYVLLFEPIVMLAEILVLSLQELGFKVDVGASSCDVDEALRARPYACVFINLDQNCQEWHDYGLALARKAAELELPVVMIPDDPEAQAVIAANGWLQIRSPSRWQR